MSELEAAKKKHEEEVARQLKARKRELQQLQAERKAVGVANGERQRFFEDKQKQLEGEEKEAKSAGAPLEGRGACLQMVKVELAAAQQAAQKLEQAAAAAEDERKRRAAEVEALKAKNKGRVGSLRVQVDSETSVAREQQKYVTLLQGRLKDDRLLPLSETDEDVKVRQRGRALVEANQAALQQRAAEMKAALHEGEAAHDAAEKRLRDAESAAAAEDAHLRENLAATRDGVSQLATYEAGLVKLLAEGGGGDMVLLTPRTGDASARLSVDGSGDVPALIHTLMSSAELASKAIDDNIKAARLSVRQRRSTAEGMSQPGTPSRPPPPPPP